jgi:hypothetical protein
MPGFVLCGTGLVAMLPPENAIQRRHFVRGMPEDEPNGGAETRQRGCLEMTEGEANGLTDFTSLHLRPNRLR